MNNKVGVTFKPIYPSTTILKPDMVANSLFGNTYSDFFYDGYKHTKGDYNISAYLTEYKDMSIIFPNNVFIPIAVNSSIRGMHEELNSLNGKYKEGVYLIETYSIGNDGVTSINHVKKIYNSIRDRNISGCKVWGDIINNILHPKNNTIPITVKIINFIPMEDLLRNDYCYIPGLNVCIAPTKDTTRALHPASKSSNMIDSIDDMLGLSESNVMDVQIIDNETPHKEYYFRMGNSITKIISKTSEVIDSRVKMTMKINGNVKKIIDETKDNFKSIGLYETYDEAETLGDVNAINESKRLDNEKARIELDRFKISSELKITIMKEAMIKFTNKVDIYKKMLDIESAKIKFKGDVYKGELEKYKLESTMSNIKRSNGLMYARDVIKLSGVMPFA